jgi:PBP1b-binding outer membrane lipoprotein LpoB
MKISHHGGIIIIIIIITGCKSKKFNTLQQKNAGNNHTQSCHRDKIETISKNTQKSKSTGIKHTAEKSF